MKRSGSSHSLTDRVSYWLNLPDVMIIMCSKLLETCGMVAKQIREKWDLFDTLLSLTQVYLQITHVNIFNISYRRE